MNDSARLSREGRGSVAASLRYERLPLIGGQWRMCERLLRFQVVDPSTGEIHAALPLCGEMEAAEAIESAASAFDDWRRRPPIERADALMRLERLLSSHREALAELTVLEQGMPLPIARAGVDYACSFFRWYAEECRRIYGRIIPSPDAGRQLLARQTPRGVAAIVTPWNAPLSSPAKKVAAALAAGCTVVLKPSELTPLSALAMAAFSIEAGIPPGVFNVVCGDAPAIGKAFVRHPAVRTISVTGSVRTGRKLYAAAARRIKHVALELGGNSPFIIFADANIERAVEDLVRLKKANSGQICVTANRVYVERAIQRDVVALLKKSYGTLVVGDGFADGVDQGPLITSEAADRVEQVVAQAISLGGVVECGGRRMACGPSFFEPTLLANVPAHARANQEEIFGPVLPITMFDREPDVIEAANRTDSRLAAYVYTSNLDRSMRMMEALEFGVVGINDPRPVTCEAPFGGVAMSGLGREGGVEGVLDFVETRVVGMRQCNS